MDISVIIVSYNVKYLLTGLLESLQRALCPDFKYEIIIIDNNSEDNTPEFIASKFQNLTIVKNKINSGFAAANNQGIALASGKYMLMINPDTLLEENVFTMLIGFLENHPDYGGATGKMLNPDGSFAIDCRHGIPSPGDAFYKAVGLSRVFPKSRHFSYYHQTYLDENEENDIPAFSGAFMLLRSEAVQETGTLDERFFMYCEDIDYCYRLNKNGWKIRYIPETRILHFKGESTNEKNSTYFKNFNLSLIRFFQKHYASTYSRFFYVLIRSGVFLRGGMLGILEKIRSSRKNSELKNAHQLWITSDNERFNAAFKKKNQSPITVICVLKEQSLDEKWISEVRAKIQNLNIKKLIIDIDLGYKVAFDIMQYLSFLKIDFAFYYKKWHLLVEKGGGRMLMNHC